MNSHRGFDYLETLVEMKERHGKWHPEKIGTIEEIFVDEFRNGEYHEEEPNWTDLSQSFTKKQYCDISLVLIHWLAAGGEIDPRTDELKTVMSYYEALHAWASNKQDRPDDILTPLEEMKTLLRAVAKREGATWGESLRLFQFVYLGIYSGLGISVSLDSRLDYDNFIQDLYDPR